MHPRNCRILSAICLIAVALLSGCGGKKSLSGEGGLTVVLPADAPHDVRVAAVQNLDLLPPADRGIRTLAAGTFEPAGTRFPAGVKVTWPLAAKRAAGEKLFIAVLDESSRTWCSTGETATVLSSGDRAAGTIYHFSTVVLQDREAAALAPSGKPVVVDPAGAFTREKKEEDARLVPRIRVRSASPPIVDKPKRDAAVKAYNEMKGRDLTLNDFKKLVATVDYATIKSLIEDGTIPAKHNHQLADWRIFVLVDSLKDFCAKNPGVKVYRSDTGNQKNAYLSDVDQTLYVYKQNEKGEWVRWPEGDALAREHCHRRLREQGISAERMEVESMGGRDRFLDERIVSAEADKMLPAELVGKKRGVVIAFTNLALGRQPGAYFLAGTVKQQQQFRVADQASKHLQGTIHADDRPIEVRETKDLLGRLNGQVCTEIGPPDDNPKGEPGVREGSYETARKVLMDGIEPDLQRGWAYDSSVDNWFKYNEKVKYALDPHKAPPVKYVLRSANTGPAALATLDNKMGYVEYEKLNDAQRRQFLIHCYGADLAAPRDMAWRARDGSSFLDRWKIVLDISAEIRNIKGGVTEAHLKEAFRPLAEKLAGPGGNWEERLGQARQEYNARCQEIMTHNMVATSKERILGWLTADPDNPKNREEMVRHVDEPEIRRALRMEDPKFDAKWQSIRKEIFGNYADTARMQLLFSFRYMDKTVIKAIIENAEKNPKLSREDVQRVRDLAAEASSLRFHYNRYKEVPSLYHHIITEWGRCQLDLVQKRLKDMVLTDIGWTDPAKGERVPSPAAKKLGLQGMDTAMQDFFRKHNRTAGFGARFVRNMTMDIGNVDGVVQVMRAWSESGGDPDAIEEAIVRETLFAVPVLGQVLSIARIQTVGEAAQTGFLLGAAMYTPAGRYAMLAFSIGEAGVAMYYSDYRAPMANAVADTLYRGFAGPSLYEFGQTPQQFTDADQAELDAIKSDRRLLHYTGADKEEIAGLLAKEHSLTNKKERWKGYVVEQSRNEGGALSGTAAQYTQKPLELEGDPEFPDDPKWMGGPMLARVTPIILYTPSKEGPVEFTVPELTGAERARMAELKRQVESEKHPIKQIEVAQELEKLVARDEAHDRAKRYLERAKTNHELMHQIRLDSLWPYILKDESHDLVNSTKFADEWIALRRDKIVAALSKMGIEADYKALRDAKEQLAERLLEDTTRSRQRWEDFERFRKGHEKAVEQWYEKAKVQAHVEGLMITVEENVNRFSDAVKSAFAEAGLDQEYTAALEYFGEAVTNRHRPISPPEVRFGGHVLRGDPDAKSEEAKQDVFFPDVKVVADPDVYVQPYSYSVFQLNPETAKAAVSSRKHKGLPLDDKMVETLTKYIEKSAADASAAPKPQARAKSKGGDAKPKKDEKVTPAFLVYAFCTDVKIPERVVPKTAAKLPALAKVSVPDGGGQAYLFGGAAMWPDLEPAEEGAFNVVVRRALHGKGQTEFLVTDEALRVFDDPARVEKDYPQVKYTIQAALAKDGPWVTTEERTFYKGNCEIKSPSPGQNQEHMRVAENQALLIDRFLSITYEKNNWPVEPLWYRVGQSTSRNLKEFSKEQFSEPAPPSLNAHIHVAGYGLRDWAEYPQTDLRKITLDEGSSPSIHIALGVDNQAFICPGAHLIVKDNGRALHYWTPRIEGDVNFGSTGSYRGLSDVMLQLTLPDGPNTLTVSGTWRNYSAERTFDVDIKDRPERFASRQKWVAERLEEKDSTVKSQKLNAEDNQRAIARAQERLTERAANPPKTYEENEPYLNAEISIVDNQYNIAMANEYHIPQAEVRYETYKAEFERDWPGVLAAVKKDVDSRKRAVELRKIQCTQKKAIYQKALALPGNSSYGAKMLQWTEADLARAKEDFLGGLRGAETTSDLLAKTGNADAVREFFDLRIEMFKEFRKDTDNKMYGHDLGRIYYFYALHTALTSADREKAAWLWTESRRLYGRPLLDSYSTGGLLPEWWPEGKDGAIFKPEPPKPKPDKDKDAKDKP